MILSGQVIEDLVRRTKRLKADGLLDLDGLHANEELIDIEPFRPEQLNPNSYNLCLGPRLKTYDIAPPPGRNGTWTHGTVRELDCARDNPTVDLLIPKAGLVLEPGRLYLGSTEEHTETYNLVPTIEGRSSVGRLGIQTHMTAGFGETFFCAPWTLEIVVVHPVRIYAGMQICQIVYSELRGRDKRNRYKGKYQGQRGPTASRLWKELSPPGP